ncbi:YiiD C-terminal domain-containing protein [Undibacterium arcticum]|uniref:YiiD C-terminal domain-containing protein n=1 Tax=Undibacterium arcticum TaxID=1762892 RepID=A0ABV7EY35_9BURK
MAPNINHQDTVFGGSVSAVAILSTWTLLHVRLGSECAGGQIVIYRNTMLYDRPITTGFTAIASMPDADAWARLLKTLNRKKMARISVPSVLICEGHQVGALEGEFVVLPE